PGRPEIGLWASSDDPTWMLLSVNAAGQVDMEYRRRIDAAPGCAVEAATVRSGSVGLEKLLLELVNGRRVGPFWSLARPVDRCGVLPGQLEDGHQKLQLLCAEARLERAHLLDQADDVIPAELQIGHKGSP